MDVLFTGVGGQGVLFASELLSSAAILEGLDVKKSEIHGMAQRGGSVISGIRFGAKVDSPIVEKTDILCAFEPIEVLRTINILKPGGKVFVNDQRIIPMTAFIGDTPYPDDPISLIEKHTKNLTVIDAVGIAKSLGRINMVNVVMIGAVSTALEFPVETWEKAIENIGKAVDLNKKAFHLGREKATK